MSEKEHIYDGIPTVDDYVRLTKSDLFKSLEKFSNDFLVISKNYTQLYTRIWIRDSYHQWGRQWEYPFVYSKILETLQYESNPKILDAGSGITFFPFFLSMRHNLTNIYCCDYNSKLTKVFDQINREYQSKIEFSTADLRSLNYKNESFDIVYCISVIEHTNDYKRIIEEFHRILSPNGTLILTFDVSIDGSRSITIEEGNELFSCIGELFEIRNELSLDLRSRISNPNILTTAIAKEMNENLLPWRYPTFFYQFKTLLTTGRFVPWPPLVTIFCLNLKKR